MLGLGAGLLSPAATILLQQRTPAANRLAVLGAVSAGMEAGGPLGSFTAGLLIASLGLGYATPLMAAMALAAAALLWHSGRDSR